MGGQRCPSHALGSLTVAQNALRAALDGQNRGEFDQGHVTASAVEVLKREMDYASTTSGALYYRNQLKTVTPGSHQEERLRAVIDEGAKIAQRNRRKENRWRANNGKGPLETAVPLTFEQQAEALEQKAAAEALLAIQNEEEAARRADPLGLRAMAASDGVSDITAKRMASFAARRNPNALGAMPVTAEDGEVAAAAGASEPEVTNGGGTATATATKPAPGKKAAPKKPAAKKPPQKPTKKAAPRKRPANKNTNDQTTEMPAVPVEVIDRAVKAEIASTQKWVERAVATPDPNWVDKWEGPSSWSTSGRRHTPAANLRAIEHGRQTLGRKEFDKLYRDFAGKYTPAEVLEAANMLDSHFKDKVTGKADLAAYQPLNTRVGADVVNMARKRAFSEYWGTDENNGANSRLNRTSRDYVMRNLGPLLATKHTKALESRQVWFPKTRTRFWAVGAATREGWFKTSRTAQRAWNTFR